MTLGLYCSSAASSIFCRFAVGLSCRQQLASNAASGLGRCLQRWILLVAIRSNKYVCNHWGLLEPGLRGVTPAQTYVLSAMRCSSVSVGMQITTFRAFFLFCPGLEAAFFFFLAVGACFNSPHRTSSTRAIVHRASRTRWARDTACRRRSIKKGMARSRKDVARSRRVGSSLSESGMPSLSWSARAQIRDVPVLPKF